MSERLEHNDQERTVSDQSSRREQVPATDSGAREEFGGVNWGAAFFGWLVAVGLGAILVALLGAAGAAVGLSAGPGAARSVAGTVSLVGAILLLVVLMVAYYCGGYVAGRMSRFDGGRQGISVWVLGLVIALVLAIVGAVAGSQYNVLAQLNQPAVPLDTRHAGHGRADHAGGDPGRHAAGRRRRRQGRPALSPPRGPAWPCAERCA